MEYRSAALDAESAYIREVSPINLLSYDDEVKLARAARQGDMFSRGEMIRHNLRLVLSVARKYRSRGLAFLDLVEEGNLGLIRAVDKYDPERGYRFSTYATWWIKQNVERGIMNYARNVRLPVHIIKEISLCLRTERELGAELGRQPRRVELAEALNKPLAQLDALLDCHESSFDSTDCPPDPDEVSADDMDVADSADPMERLHASTRKLTLHRWLAALGERQREVIIRRFGLLGHQADTLENVGREVGLTRERVRQLQLEAIRRLRSMASSEGCDISVFF
ncbi:MAG TPA: RNA polymerase sigma factor RpoS [Pseudohongiella sp.]|nr:RNA polymerase sigma factor RpoS [Pseudohongiella sp.]|tara:strand:- start:54 stop:896 length:843 start_codon:yes stop_codon:yes gene_type:complete